MLRTTEHYRIRYYRKGQCAVLHSICNYGTVHCGALQIGAVLSTAEQCSVDIVEQKVLSIAVQRRIITAERYSVA